MTVQDSQSLFSISDTKTFEACALAIFNYQYTENAVYQEYCSLLGVHPKEVSQLSQIPFLPISFFKEKSVITGKATPTNTFESSGTTGSSTSKHFVTEISLYQESFRTAFQQFYGDPKNLCILALLPSYLERTGSSLVYMVDDLIQRSEHPSSGFYLHNLKALHQKIVELEASQTPTLLIGVSFALLDLAEQFPTPLKHTIIMETGGMKGKRKEMIREELHQELRKAFQVKHIHSEYGMTELLSQCYSKGNGIFESPPWMKVLIRDPEDPLSLQTEGKSGGVNIIDLANLHSCSFIATQDLGKVHADGSFEIIGRFDHSDIRGCNLMAL